MASAHVTAATAAVADAAELALSAGFKRRVREYSNLTDEEKSVSALEIVSDFVQSVREKGVSCAVWAVRPEILAGIAEAVSCFNKASTLKRASKKVKSSLSIQELFDQKVLPKIMFVIAHYANGVFDSMDQLTEAQVNSVMADANATAADFAHVNHIVCKMQSSAFNIALIGERLRGQLIESAIAKFATTDDGTVDEDAKKTMLKDVFGICADTANRIMNLSKLFQFYPRLMFMSLPPANFIQVWKPLKAWLTNNAEEAAKLQMGFGAISIGARVSLNATTASYEEETVTPSVADRQYMPEFVGLQERLLAPPAYQPPAHHVQQHTSAAAAAFPLLQPSHPNARYRLVRYPVSNQAAVEDENANQGSPTGQLADQLADTRV